MKADGDAAGKGVVIARDRDEAMAAVRSFMVERSVGAAGDRVLLEEFLEGVELSVLAFTDGKTIVPMMPACDYKRVGDDDEGPNTGGMGAYAPPRFATPELMATIQSTILEPTIAAMAAEGRPYSGVLYAGLMITADGPKVIEFNCRMGDPETQVVLPLLKTDLAEIALSVVEGRLDRQPIEWEDAACCGVVLASGGYPGRLRDGLPHRGTRLPGGWGAALPRRHQGGARPGGEAPRLVRAHERAQAGADAGHPVRHAAGDGRRPGPDGGRGRAHYGGGEGEGVPQRGAHPLQGVPLPARHRVAGTVSSQTSAFSRPGQGARMTPARFPHSTDS